MVTEARRRVLTRYRRHREEGKAPHEAMALVQLEADQRNFDEVIAGAGNSRTRAEAEWDAFYARRYGKIIGIKGLDLDYWRRPAAPRVQAPARPAG